MKTFASFVAVVLLAVGAMPAPAQVPAITPSPTVLASDVPASPVPLATDLPTSKPIDPTSAPDPEDSSSPATPVPESVLDSGSPAMRARTRSLIAQMESGTYDVSRLTAAMKTSLTPARRKRIAKELASLGRPSLVTFTSLDTINARVGVLRQYKYAVVFASAKMTLTFGLDSAGRLDGFVYDLKKSPNGG